MERKKSKFSFSKLTSMSLTFAFMLCFAAGSNFTAYASFETDAVSSTIRTDGASINTDESGLQYSVSNGEATITGYTGTDTEIDIPSTLGGYPVTVIGNKVFDGRVSLKSITIPDSVTSIGDGAFLGCRNLKSVTIPDSVTSIGMFAFNYCSSLKSIEVSKNNNYYSSIDGVIFNRPPRKLTSGFKINDSTDQIQSQAVTHSAVTIGIFHNFKNLDLSIDVFNENAFM